MIESTITTQGQITLPAAVRASLSIKPGDKVRYLIQENGVLILPVKPVDHLRGILKYNGPPATLEDMERAIVEGACRGPA